MSAFEFFFSFYGLLLGLSVAELVGGFARVLHERERIRVALRRAGVAHIQLRTDRDWVEDIARFVLSYRRVASQLHQPPQGVSR